MFTPRTATPSVFRGNESAVSHALKQLNTLNDVQRSQFALLRRYARHPNVPILIEGPTGTGKTTIARTIHQLSPRRGHVFKQLSLSAVEDTLVASELFGHVAGAFTDARHSRKGAFSSAAGGTLFLDELGKASTKVQSMLLTSVETGVILPQGSDLEVRADVRLIASSNIDIQILVRSGSFLPDLAARIGMFVVRLLPLNERREDIAPIALQIIERRSAEFGFNAVPTIQAELLAALCSADWPLNIRELDAVLMKLLFHASENGTCQ